VIEAVKQEGMRGLLVISPRHVCLISLPDLFLWGVDPSPTVGLPVFPIPPGRQANLFSYQRDAGTFS
jgi:hypothetical protein